MSYITKRPVFGEIAIDNFMFVDHEGRSMTRCWDRHGMYEVETDKAAMRPAMKSGLNKIEVDGSSFSDRQQRHAAMVDTGISEKLEE